MAVDQTGIALAACIKTVNDVTNILKSMDSLESTQEQLVAAGINLSSFSNLLENDARTKHCDAATYKDILQYFVVTIRANMNLSDGVTQQAIWTGLQKARLLTNGPVF